MLTGDVMKNFTTWPAPYPRISAHQPLTQMFVVVLFQGTVIP